MRVSSRIIAIASLVALASCGEPQTETADDFAARVGNPAGGSTVANGTVAPTVQEPLPDAAPGPFQAGTQTDPNSACGANKVGEFIGKLADDPTRVAVQQAAEGTSEVRFVGFGVPVTINPDPASPRLNLMLDAQGIIRDARCG